MKTFLAMVVAAVVVGGCATVTRDRDQNIGLMAPNCSEPVKCTFTNKKGSLDRRGSGNGFGSAVGRPASRVMRGGKPVMAGRDRGATRRAGMGERDPRRRHRSDRRCEYRRALGLSGVHHGSDLHRELARSGRRVRPPPATPPLSREHRARQSRRQRRGRSRPSISRAVKVPVISVTAVSKSALVAMVLDELRADRVRHGLGLLGRDAGVAKPSRVTQSIDCGRTAWWSPKGGAWCTTLGILTIAWNRWRPERRCGRDLGDANGAHMPQTVIGRPSRGSSRRKILSSQRRPSVRSKTTRCPASAAERSM